jgi:hypothetical protein
MERLVTVNIRSVFRPLLADLDMSESEFNELERAGRAYGLFETGRSGPGGGTPANLKSVTLVLIALMAGTTKRNGARLALEYFNAPADHDSTLTFGEALTTTLTEPTWVDYVMINQTDKTAAIYGTTTMNDLELWFACQSGLEISGIGRTTNIYGDFLRRLSARIALLGIYGAPS